MDVEKWWSDFEETSHRKHEHVPNENEDTLIMFQGPITRSRAKKLQFTLPSISHPSHDELI